MSYKQDDSRKWVKKTTQDALNRLFKPDPLHVSVEFKKLTVFEMALSTLINQPSHEYGHDERGQENMVSMCKH